MKSSASKPRYFSAYPLKAVEEQATPSSNQHQSPYLRSLLAGNKRSITHLRVYPMTNPSPDHTKPVALRPGPVVAAHGDEKDWFKAYE